MGRFRVKTGDLLDLPTLLHLGLLPVIHGTPPYGLFEHPPTMGLIPPHRTDTGALLMAEVLVQRVAFLSRTWMACLPRIRVSTRRRN